MRGSGSRRAHGIAPGPVGRHPYPREPDHLAEATQAGALELPPTLTLALWWWHIVAPAIPSRSDPGESEVYVEREPIPYGWPQDPAYRRDLAEALGLVVCTPSFLYSDPGEDPNPGVDILAEYHRLIGELKEEMVRLAPNASFPTDPDAIRHHPYDIGHAGKGGPWPFSVDLVEIAANVNILVQTVAGYVEVGRLLLDVGRWWKDRLVANGKYDAGRDRPVFLGETIRLMCVGHAYERYKARPKALPQGYLRPGPTGSLQHPMGTETYTIVVPAGRKTYVYLVTGRGTVLDHYSIERGRITGLELPDWFGDARILQEVRQAHPLRQVDLEGVTLADVNSIPSPPGSVIDGGQR